MKTTKGKLKTGIITLTTAVGTSSPPPSVPSTTAFSLFQSSIKRARNLLEIHRLAHSTRKLPRKSLADAHRAAVVLAVSALDAYVRTLVIAKIVAIVANPSEKIPDKLQDQIKNYLDQDSLLEAARKGDISYRVGKAFRKKYEDKSFQGVENIIVAMKLLGIDDVFATIAKKAMVNEAILKRDLGIYTNRRHIIAHCGDYDLNQTPPVEKNILKKDVLSCIRTVELIAREINEL